MVSIRPKRGATQNRLSARFNLLMREDDGDWLDERAAHDEASAPPRTTVTVEHANSIIAHNQSPDVPFDRSVNAYRGCEHGCIYCFARPTHAFHDLSPGIDFETKLFAKPNAAALLRAELSKTRYKVAPIAMGTNTDPYQPIERKWNITRECVEILAETNHPLMITTKSDRILRDLDLLAPMAVRGLLSVMISVTSLDPKIAMTLEPRAPAPGRRIEAIRHLAAAGIPVQISISPLIPAITDHETEAILKLASEAGARSASFIPVRLPHEVAPLFRDWLDAHYPDRAAKVMNIIRSIRGGNRDNDPKFGTRMRGTGPWYELMRRRFVIACRKYNLSQPRVTLRTDLFKPPEGPQGSLF